MLRNTYVWLITAALTTVAATAANAAVSAKKPTALMPLQSGLGTKKGTGEAWAPLLASLIAERGSQPLYAPALELGPTVAARVAECRSAACYQDIGAALGAQELVAGGVTREGGQYFVTLTRYDLRRFEEVGRVERHFAITAALDAELAAALEALYAGPSAVAHHQASPTEPVVDAPPALAPVSYRTPEKTYRYRALAWTLTAVGAVSLAGGGGMLAYTLIERPRFDAAVVAYNTAEVRTQAAFDALVQRENLLYGLGLGAYVALGVGAAALTAGIVLFVIDGKDTSAEPEAPRVGLVPTGNGGALIGTF